MFLLAALSSAASATLCADDTVDSDETQLQLLAPLNSTLKMRPADTNWTPRATDQAKPSAPKSAVKIVPPQVSHSPKTAVTTQKPDGDANDEKRKKAVVPAMPASGPLDRFRRPDRIQDRVDQSKTTVADKGSRLGVPIATPGDRLLDQRQTPALPTTNTWHGRSVSQRKQSATLTPRQAISDVASDGFAKPAQEGNWVARDAINRIEPLRDPNAAAPSPVNNQPATGPARNVELQLDERRGSEPSRNEPSDLEPLLPPPAQENRATQSMSLDEAEARREQADTSESPELALEPELSLEPAGQTKEPSSQDANSSVGEQPSVAPPVNRSTDADWAEEMLRSLAEPTRQSSPNPRSVELSPAAPERAASAPVERKRQIRRDAVAEVSSAAKPERAAEQPERATDAISAPASASVGDLALENETPPRLDYTGRPAEPIRLSRNVAGMRRGIERTLRYFYERPEVATGRSNWGMMHSMMVFGADTQVIVGRKRFSAIAWIAGNNNCRGQRLLTQDENGLLAKSGVGLQGHQGQFLAVLAMCNVPVNYPLHAGKMKYDVAALIESEKRLCKAGEELTFTLIGLSHYLDTDSTWLADDGTEWGFERLIAEELKQPIVGTACGGTHRLMGYAHALRKRRAEGKPITGHWKRAETFLGDFVDYAYSLQNRDGSMSTKWFEGRADNGEVDRKIQTTGHIVEWLLTITPDAELQDRRLVAAVAFLLRSMGSELDHDWSIGPKGHALRSLAMYHQRVFQAGSPWIPTGVAQRPARRR